MWHSVGNGEGFTPDHLPLTAPAVHLKEENSMKARMSFAVMVAVLAALVLAPASQAQTPTKKFAQKVALTGKSKSGRSFKGTYTIDRFTKARKGRYAGKLVSVGTVRGKSGHKRYVKSGVVMPAKLTPASGSAQQLPNIPGACQILNLRLAPITLNLLGLVVRTNDINLRIDAIPSGMPGGGLLGDLLCSVNNLLNGGGWPEPIAARPKENTAPPPSSSTRGGG